MKKYQLWLERKTYSQHLSNLARIKLAISQRSLLNKHVSQPQKQKKLTSYQSHIKLDNTLLSHQQSYIITARELQGHKLRLVRSREIVRQNQSMAKRINRTKPIVSNTQSIDYSNYKLKRKMQRSNEYNSEKLKNKNYQQFIKLQKRKIALDHNFQMFIKIQSVELRITHHPSTEVALQILAPESLGKSQFVKPEELSKRSFNFTFSKQLPKVFILRFHCNKALQHTILGDFVMSTPELGGTVAGEWPTYGLGGIITGNITYTKMQPKFWSIKRFKI